MGGLSIDGNGKLSVTAAIYSNRRFVTPIEFIDGTPIFMESLITSMVYSPDSMPTSYPISMDLTGSSELDP